MIVNINFNKMIQTKTQVFFSGHESGYLVEPSRRVILAFFSFLIILVLSFQLGCATSSEKDLSRAQRVQLVEDTRKEIGLGRLVAARIIANYGVYKNQKIKKYVNLIGKGIALYVGRPELSYKFEILNSNIINAFAAPGGYIFITKGLLLELNDEAELASVLAHEIAHVNLKHIMKNIRMPKTSKSFVERLATILSSQSTLVSSAFGKVAEQVQEILFEKGLKREDEFEADEYGMKYAFMTGYDSGGLIRFCGMLARMRDKKGWKKTYSTHPSASDRLAKLRIVEKENNFVGGSIAKDRFLSMKSLIK